MSINPSFGSSSSPHNSDLSKNTCAFSMPNRHRELLFEKPLTPSDVGKLNRLVIPKQFAEKHFPLRSGSRGGSGESFLCFEDEFGRMWRFRYSYWTSSQSYVLTKGWSRYVKEKALTAGDIVSFQSRQCNNGADTDRLFITWRSCEHNATVRRRAYKNMTGEVWSRSTFFPCCPNLSPEFAGRENKMVSISSNPRRLRLFGVNMEFAESESSDASSDVSPSSVITRSVNS